MDFAAMAELCAPNVEAGTLSRIVSVESGFNPFAIGVVGARLERQPTNLDEAVVTADMLAAGGYNFSLGLAQINRTNFAHFGLTARTAFDPCTNLRVGAMILLDCYDRASRARNPLGNALSCYNSGNFSAGYRNGYVAKVLNAGASHTPTDPPPGAIAVVPDKAPTRVRSVPQSASPAEALLSTKTPTKATAAKGAGTALLF